MVKQHIEKFDRAVVFIMRSWGHFLHRVCLGLIFLWFGSLKVFGHESATSLIAKTVYFGDPEIIVPVLGFWEALIGLCLMYRPLLRVALLLLFVRLPGTALALILQWDVCFFVVPWVPTVEGQYLLKDFMIFSAAAIIGGTVGQKPEPGERL